MKRRLLLGSAAAAALLATGCAAPGNGAPAAAGSGSPRTEWNGRLSLRVDSATPQNFAALFELRGSPRAGELILTSPIGSTLGVLRWSPGRATLQNGRDIHEFDSVDALSEAATGAAIPIEALFGWLQGRAQEASGWHANLSQVADGRLQATRQTPQPTAELRVIFDVP